MIDEEKRVLEAATAFVHWWRSFVRVEVWKRTSLNTHLLRLMEAVEALEKKNDPARVVERCPECGQESGQ